MRHAVVVEVGAGGEAFAAHGALVGLLPRVDPAVSVEGRRRGEGLAANITGMRLLTCTQPHRKVHNNMMATWLTVQYL